MANYLYVTESGECDGIRNHAEVVMEGCNGRFQLSKPMAESQRSEKCKICKANLRRDIPGEGAPPVKFNGPGFYVNDYAKGKINE